jgi:hypothetical protein
MSLNVWLVTPMVVARAATVKDKYGNPVRDFASSDASRVDVYGRLVEHSQEETPDAQVVLTKAVAYLPAGTEVAVRDVIEVEGVEWEVAGVTNKSLPVASGAYVRAEVERITHG